MHKNVLRRIEMKYHRYLRHLLLIALFLITFMNNSTPIAAYAQKDEHKTVRVGWFDSSFNNYDQSGRRSGYAYEYQQKLAAYNGWCYEYVNGSWSELLQMLKDGEIDLLSDVSYLPERENYMLFSELPMGTEQYYLFAARGNDSISHSDRSTLNGKKVAVNKSSYQKDLFIEWAEHNNVHSELVEVTCSEDESLLMLENGETDAYVTIDSFMDPARAVPVYKIGSSDYYFAVNRDRPDLLEDLNSAMSSIQDENRYYNQRMFEKYMQTHGANAVLSARETDWLEYHGTIKVGYQDNYMAFCSADKATGELTGVLKDYLETMSDCIPNTRLEFEAVSYPTAADAMNALKNGEVDCVFPANLSGFEAESKDIECRLR